MGAGLLAQYVVVALAVVLSAAFVIRQQWPDGVRQLRARLALWLLRDGRRAGLRRIGRAIAPAPSLSGAGCGTCNGCDPG